MARVEWVDMALHNWARWKITGGSGAGARSPWPTASSVFEIRTRGGYREASIPIIDTDAVLMDAALAALAVSDERLHRTVCRAYLDDLTRIGVAEAEGIAVSTVMVRLEQADRAIVTWFRLRAEELAARAGRKDFDKL